MANATEQTKSDDSVQPKKTPVYMLMNHNRNFAGETCSFPDEEAQVLIQKGVAAPVDENLNPIVAERPKPTPLGTTSADSKVDQQKGGQKETDPFVVDGLSAALSAALNKADLKGPEDVREFLKEGKSLTSIPGITSANAKKIAEMYTQE